MGTTIEGAEGAGTRLVLARQRTLIVDDHPMFRLALREVLARLPELDVVAEAGTVGEAMECLAQRAYDIAIVDLVLPDGRGLALVNHVLNAQPECRVLVLSAVDEPTRMAEILRAGASGYALKSQPVSEIVDALHAVIAGRRSVPEEAREEIDALLNSPNAWPIERLTRREREVFELIALGHTNEDIAGKLRISRRTVETHRQRIMNKLGSRSVGQLLQHAVRHGIV
jgi:DNA-binding NarL/FixJ family response regulator